MDGLTEFTLMEFPGFPKDTTLPTREKADPMLNCVGGSEEVKKYLKGETPKLRFTFRPNDKCSSPLPVNEEKCKNKLVVSVKDGKLRVVGIVTRQLSINTLAPFQVLDRCTLNMLIPNEQEVPSPLEINTVRMTKIENPAAVNFQPGKEKENSFTESHPHSLPFRKTRTKTKKTTDQSQTLINKEDVD